MILRIYMFFFFNDTATTEIYTLSLHDALPISHRSGDARVRDERGRTGVVRRPWRARNPPAVAREDGAAHDGAAGPRSEEHTSELQSRQYFVCRLLLEKKNILLLMSHGPVILHS